MRFCGLSLRWLLSVIFILSTTAEIAAQNIKQVPTGYTAELVKQAENRDANAQFSLGYEYATGQGVPKDEVEAVRWYRKAAEQGNADAQFFLGDAYYFGKGVPKNNAESDRWYRKVAEQGNADAQYLLGLSYATGEGVPEDKAEAVRWYRKAAEQGYVRSVLPWHGVCQ